MLQGIVNKFPFFGFERPNIVILDDSTTKMAEYFKDVSEQIQGGFMVVIPATMGLFAVKCIWTTGKRFFTSLSS